MADEREYSRILVDLDSILDTRIGTINLIDSEIVKKVLASGKYHTRDEDVFEGIDRQLFRERYKNRDRDTLSASLISNCITLFKHLVTKLAEQAIQRPFHKGAEIVVNYFPYVLSTSEINDIKNAISFWIKDIAPVTMVSYSLKELTPIHCKTEYSLIVMYDYQEWLETHTEAFKMTHLPEVSMFVPAIYFIKKPTEKELSELTKETLHPFKAVEAMISPIIDLNVIDVSFFSILSKEA